MLKAEDLDKLRAEHPGGIIHLVGADKAWECVFRAPNRAQYKMYRANVHNDARVSEANETIALQTVVYPSRDAFDSLLDTFPGIPETLAADETFKKLTGLRTEAGAKA